MPAPAWITVRVPAPKGDQAMPKPGPNRKRALFSLYTESPTTDCVCRTPPGPKTKLEAVPRGEFQPLLNSCRMPRVTVRFDLRLMVSWAYQAPAHCRHGISSGLNVAVTCEDWPCSRCCRSENWAMPLR